MVEVKNLDLVIAKLDRLQKQVSPAQMKVKLNMIGSIMANSIQQSFDDEKSPFGERWKPISANTAFSYFGGRKNAYTKNGKRQRSGFLNAYGAGGSKKLLWQSGNLAQRWVVRATSTSVTISNNSSNKGFAYGLAHQFGSAKKNTPARPFLPIKNGNLEPRLAKNIIDYIEDELIKALK
ncbi:phage virion morphogenesis protein [Campylobacter sp. 9BO]|uniref:phage virion morphogenesis protein n=1 Tax=Campylobacter sp. 9BO TaxID=3424759 RepID=UPI003D3505FB